MMFGVGLKGPNEKATLKEIYLFIYYLVAPGLSCGRRSP